MLNFFHNKINKIWNVNFFSDHFDVGIYWCSKYVLINMYNVIAYVPSCAEHVAVT